MFKLRSSLLSVAARGADVAQHLGLGRGGVSGVCVLARRFANCKLSLWALRSVCVCVG